MDLTEFENALDVIRDSIPIGDEIEKLANRKRIPEPMKPAFKTGVLASSMVVLKKFEEIYIKMIEKKNDMSYCFYFDMKPFKVITYSESKRGTLALKKEILNLGFELTKHDEAGWKEFLDRYED